MEISVEDFLEKSNVKDVLNQLTSKFKDKPLVISDVTDENYQYVDLVQEGGGVWGIALVGFTYILEEMGIRFFSLAGTSAGSINAMLLACSGNKEDAKSEKIIEELLHLDFFKIVDGKKSNWRFTKFVKRIIQKFVVKKNFVGNLVNTSKWIAGITLLLTFGSFASNFFIAGSTAKWIGFAAGVLLLIVIIFIIYLYFRFKNFTKNGYGLNEGEYFHNWIKQTISKNRIGANADEGFINTVVDFKDHFKIVPPGLKVKRDPKRFMNDPPDTPILTIIVSDITAERKIEFPRMCDLYWRHLKDIHPGDFVRASMSIPVFFETYTLTNINENSTLKIWSEQLNWKADFIPDKEQFIDGGILSNFPISVFANPANPIPRMPTIGIRLKDSLPDQTKNNNSTLGAFATSIIGTMRTNYDRDFMSRNRAFDIGVKEVILENHNWLNFFMTIDEKIEIFNCGAEAAKEFLMEFDWEKYKVIRFQNWQEQNNPSSNPNNY